MSKSRYYTPRVVYARAALEKGALVKRGYGWVFGRRIFADKTVQTLIDEGLAVRLGDRVVKRLEAAE